MIFAKKLNISGQLMLAIALLFTLSSVAQGRAVMTKKAKFKPTYKVERCDCLGFSEDIPTFLSDLAGADDLSQLDIFGEGNTLQVAETNAQNMCIETYRNFASVSKSESAESVTQSGCKKLKSTPDGEWVAI